MERKGLSRRKGSKEEEFIEEGWVSEQEEIVCELRGEGSWGRGTRGRKVGVGRRISEVEGVSWCRGRVISERGTQVRKESDPRWGEKGWVRGRP